MVKTCAFCEKTDGMCYTSNPPKRKCTVTGKFHEYDHICDVPKTNADRIRAMSDEELVEKLYCFTDIDCKNPYCKNLDECEKLLDTEDGIPAEKCKRCLLEWLRQPAEDRL